MILLGLTGSIGMGKSTAAKMLRILGVPVHDSDKAVHTALTPGGAAYEQVRALFPSTCHPVTGTIDRKKLGNIVFHDKELLKKLEDILHPAARESAITFIRDAEAMGKKVVALEIPLLFETGSQERVDYTITVTSPPEVQKERVMKRPGMTEEKFYAILKTQMPDVEKRDKSYFVVDTGKGYFFTFMQLRSILKIVGA